MNDDQLKRDIEEAVSVQPSPQFAAGVRARIAESPRPSSAWIRWGIPAAGFAMAAVVTFVMFVEPQEPEVQRRVVVVQRAQEKSPDVTPMPTPQRPALVRRAVQPARQTATEPEVLIDPREVAAFREFVEGVRDDRIDLAKVIELQRAAAKTAPIGGIALMPIGDLEPIVIESLRFGGRGIEGGRL
jgi:hypothetical protein